MLLCHTTRERSTAKGRPVLDSSGIKKTYENVVSLDQGKTVPQNGNLLSVSFPSLYLQGLFHIINVVLEYF